jgi:OFA family oxalate/formate antiporter-like MFS transporter
LKKQGSLSFSKAAIQVRKYLTVLASFIIMLCIGSVYAWSFTASELMKNYHFSAVQSQFIFGTVIAVFPAAMIFISRLAEKIKIRYIGYASGLLFLCGYLIASYSNGSYIMVFTGLGLVSGIATGLGYWLALTVPLKWFPGKKGLITGITTAGFGLGAVFMSVLSEMLMANGKEILELFGVIGILYGSLIIAASNLIFQNNSSSDAAVIDLKKKLFTGHFVKLFGGIFLGTFAGLMIIGSLKIIGEQSEISNHVLILGVSFFAVANFSGRLFWGFLSDYTGAYPCIFAALLIQALAIISLDVFPLNDISYLIISFFTGFGFGGNFVLFAKQTANIFGLENLKIIYPYVFLGYAAAGIAGPLCGGFLLDYYGTHTPAIILSAFISLTGSLIFFIQLFILRINEYSK